MLDYGLLKTFILDLGVASKMHLYDLLERMFEDKSIYYRSILFDKLTKDLELR